FAGAPGTAKAPLTNAAFAGGLAFGGGCCWAAARPTLPTNASASALGRTRSHRMAVSFSSARDGVIPPTHQQTIFLFDHLVAATEQRRETVTSESGNGSAYGQGRPTSPRVSELSVIRFRHSVGIPPVFGACRHAP